MTVSMVIGVFVKIFFLLTPFFVLSVYVTLTRGEEHMTRRKLAVRTTVAVLVIVMILYLFGEAIFRYLGITLDAFRIGSGIVLLLSMFCNALASLVAMLTYMEQKQAVFRKHKKLTLAAAAVLSWIGSLAGFGDLISVIFPVFGYLSVVFLVCMMVHFIQCKRREKQSA